VTVSLQSNKQQEITRFSSRQINFKTPKNRSKHKALKEIEQDNANLEV